MLGQGGLRLRTHEPFAGELRMRDVFAIRSMSITSTICPPGFEGGGGGGRDLLDVVVYADLAR